MSLRVKSITSKLESVFRQTKSLSNEEYESILMNIELLKKRYFNPSFRKEHNHLFEKKEIIDIVDKEKDTYQSFKSFITK